MHVVEARWKLAFGLQYFTYKAKEKTLSQHNLKMKQKSFQMIWKIITVFKKEKNGYKIKKYLFFLHLKMVQIFVFPLIM